MKIIMKYNLPILILLLLISTFSLNSQSKQMQAVPPTYWENYMSFKIGNYFEYEYNGGLLRYSRKIVDTVMQSSLIF